MGVYTMSEIKLNIYNRETKELKKTYTTDSIELMFGTVEDILAVVDIEKFNDEKAVAVMIIKAWKELKPFLKDVFPGITDEDIRGIKINDMIPTFMDIFRGISENMGVLVSGKNQNREPITNR